MGITVSVFLMNEDTLHREDFIRWITDSEITLPKSVPPSRWPTMRDFKSVLEGLENCGVAYATSLGTYCIRIRDTVSEQQLYIWNYSGNEDELVEFHFDKLHNEQLVERILKGLSPICGTFLLMYDGEPVTFFASESATS